MKIDDCQRETYIASSKPASWLLIKYRRLQSYMDNGGMRAILARIFWRAKQPFCCEELPQDNHDTPQMAARALPAVRLNPGDLVEVKSEDEVRNTLDVAGRNGGLRFLPEMAVYCGKQFKVFKRVEHIMMEDGSGFRTLKNTVILDGVICEGRSLRCDRSCFLFWRESWLRRINGADSSI